VKPLSLMRACAPATGARPGCLALIRTDVGGGYPAGYHGLYRGRTVTSSGSRTTAAAPGSPAGYGPQDLQAAYNLTASASSAGGSQTIGIVDLYDDPNAESDLAVYRAQYGLPACTTANGCFEKVNQQGQQGSYPVSDAGWDAEISLDLDMVSAICPNCHIVLVEVDPSSSIGVGVDVAVQLGANAISNSYTTGEASGGYDAHFDHPGHIITAAVGDGTYSQGLFAPAVYNTVVAVGGTTLSPAGNARGWTETVWNGLCQNGTVICGTVSGCSADVMKPAWQTDSGCSRRMVADVAAVADPTYGVAVYDSIPYKGASGWLVLGGTSASSPIIAAVYGLAGAEASLSSSQSLYFNASSLYDVTSGNDGTCSPAPAYFCTAGTGYDGPSGNGTPNGIGAFQAPLLAQSLSIGPDGTVWLIGGFSTSNLTNIYKYSGGALRQVAGSATQIAVDSNGAPWVVNGAQSIYHWNGSSFVQVAGSAEAIATGPNGSMWVIGTDSGIYEYTSSGFVQAAGSATKIAVDQNGYPWVVNGANQIYRFTSLTANTQVAGSASAIAIGLNGGVWCLGIDAGGHGHSVYHWNGSAFVQVPGQATQLAVDQNGAAWVINSANLVYRYDTGSGTFQQVYGL
jgi:subtilase family serine protease